MLTEETIIDKIEFVGEHRHMQLREATVIKRDGVEISRSFHRRVLHAGVTDDDGEWFDADISGEDADIQAIAGAGWTAATKSAAHLREATEALEVAQGGVDATSQAVVAIETRIAALEDGADTELPPAEAAKAAAIAKRDTVQTNIDAIA